MEEQPARKAANEARSSAGAYLPGTQRERVKGLQSFELQATALRILNEYEDEIREHEEKIRELREHHTPAMKSLYNSAACINQLPIELLTHIFRAVGPRTSPADAIRLIHVCRYWRSVINHTPAFWVDFLDSTASEAWYKGDPSVVLAAFERSAPVAQLGCSLSGDYVLALQTIPAHLSRISTLRLDCTEMDSACYSDICSFFHLQLPHLEDLTLWLARYHQSVYNAAKLPATIPFPNLRCLRTNCLGIPFNWLGPTLRELWLGSNRSSFTNSCPEPEVCCPISAGYKVDKFWAALARCPDLKRLGLDDCLRSFAVTPPSQLCTLAFSALEVLQLVGATDTIGVIVGHMLLPDWTDVRLFSYCSYHSLNSLIPTRIPLSCIPSICRLVVDIGDVDNELSAYAVWGGADEGDHRLSLHSSSDDVYPSDDENFDLRRFFEGFAPIFLLSSITYLEINCFDSFADNGCFTYLLHHYPHLNHLVMHDLQGSTSLFEALAQDGISPHLQELEVRLIASETAMHAERETMISVLEARASRGLRLQRFSLGEVVDPRLSHKYHPALPPVDDRLVRRLEAIVQELSIREPCHRKYPVYPCRRHGDLVWGS